MGRLGRPHGLEGYLGLYVDPDDLVHFEPGSTVMVGEHRLTIRAVREGKKGPQVAFDEVVDRDGAEQIRGSDVFAEVQRRLGDNEFWPRDLIGLEVRPGGGVVVGVDHGVGQDRLVIERTGVTFAVPFVDELVPVIDLEGGYLEIVEIEGLSQL